MARVYKTAENIFKYFIRIAACSLYRFCWLCVHVLECITKTFRFKSHQETSKSATLGRIMWRQKFYNMRHVSLYDFICLYRTRGRPDYVLQPNVSLYSVTTKEAIFVETPASVNIYNSDVHPFFFVAQFLNATKVIKISIKDFVSLADKIGDPTVPVLWISNTGRCGGTMLCQVFETLPGTLVINEPDTPTNVHNLSVYNKILDSEYQTLLKSIIRFLCKPTSGIKRVCIKPRPMCSAMMLDITKFGLDIGQIFIYRNCLDSVKSVLAVMVQDPEYDAAHFLVDLVWFSKLFPYFNNLLIYRFVPSLKTVIGVPPNTTTAGIFTSNWVNQILIAREAMSRDKSILPVRYEDISTRTMEAVVRIFDHLGIDTKHIGLALSSLCRDSQRGSVLSRDNIEDASNRYITAIDRSRSDAILFKCNLPLMGEDFSL